MFIPRSLANLTFSNGWLFTATIESSVGSDFENVIRSSLHLVSFNWNFVARVWSTRSLADSWILLFPSLGTASANVVSSISGFQKIYNLSAFMSLIITRKSHGPNFAPCGTPAGTAELLYYHVYYYLSKSGLHTEISMQFGKTKDNTM